MPGAGPLSPFLEQGGRPPGEPPWPGFLIALAATVVLLAFTIASGRAGRRRLHVVCVAMTLPALATAIFFAERVGGWWRFPPPALAIHLSFAWAATVAVVLAAGSGVLHLRGRIPRPRHARFAWLFVALAGGAILTGAWIFLAGSPKV